MSYICPMHPEITEDKPARCSKCGMDLVESKPSNDKAGSDPPQTKDTTWKAYMPLLVVFWLLLLTTIVITIGDYREGTFTINKTLSYFMIGFFLTFAGFKLFDLKGFAQGFFTYDLLAKKFFSYGYIYPFIELFFGLSMILIPESRTLLFVELFVMTFSGLGVTIKLLKKEQFQCSCLGTFLKVPLTKVTLIEDFGMAFLALVMLVILI